MIFLHCLSLLACKSFRRLLYYQYIETPRGVLLLFMQTSSGVLFAAQGLQGCRVSSFSAQATHLCFVLRCCQTTSSLSFSSACTFIIPQSASKLYLAPLLVPV